MILEELMLGIGLFLIRLPPFYFIPSLGLLSLSHNVARLLVIVLFVYIFLFTVKKQPIRLPSTIFLLISVFTISQSISIIHTTNISSFLTTYKDYVFGILFFYLSFALINEKNVGFFIKTLLLSTIIQILYEITVYFYPSFIFEYLQPFLYEKYWSFLIYQLNRVRYFGDSFDEVVVSLITWQYFKSKHKSIKIILIMLFLGIIFITLISNWRTKAILLIISMISSYFIFIKKTLKKSFPILLLLIFSLYIFLNISKMINNKNIINRVFDNPEEQNTVTTRFNYWEDAFSIGSSSPIFGVGLGNYFDNLMGNVKLQNFDSVTNRKIIIIDDPHNIFAYLFASTGIVGVICFAILTYYFLTTDIAILTQEVNSSIRMWVIMFWLIFLYGLFNPSKNLPFYALFWFLRGVVEKLRIKNKPTSLNQKMLSSNFLTFFQVKKI